LPAVGVDLLQGRFLPLEIARFSFVARRAFFFGNRKLRA